jgi:hypothetical protein
MYHGKFHDREIISGYGIFLMILEILIGREKD